MSAGRLYEKFPLADVPVTTMDIKHLFESGVNINPIRMTDKMYIDLEFQFQSELAIVDVLQTNVWKLETIGIQLLVEMGAIAEGEDPTKQKVCQNGCQIKSYNRSIRCIFLRRGTPEDGYCSDFNGGKFFSFINCSDRFWSQKTSYSKGS